MTTQQARCTLDARTHNGLTLESLAIGLLQKLAVGPTDRRNDPSHLIDVGGGEEDVVEANLEAFLLARRRGAGRSGELGSVERDRLDPLRVRLLRQLHLWNGVLAPC